MQADIFLQSSLTENTAESPLPATDRLYLIDSSISGALYTVSPINVLWMNKISEQKSTEIQNRKKLGIWSACGLRALGTAVFISLSFFKRC